jgi:aminoglycoside phosphotransferase (APT) family kinase protein
VLRLIGEHSVYPIVDAEQQFLCQRLIAQRSAAPVPPVYGYEADPGPVGASFILMARAEGRGAPDWPSYVAQGWLHDLSDEERSTLWRNAVASVAAVHATPLHGVDVGRLGLPTPGARPIDRLVSYWQLYHRVVSAEGRYPALDAAIAWLDAARPELDEPPTMVWGDASLRNMLFDRLAPSALLDLEFAHIGVPQFDIAFFAMMDRVMAEGYAGLPRLGGFADEAETFDLYESLSGIEVRDRDYFCRMAVTYMALANTRVFQRLAAEGRMPADDVGRNPPLRFLGRMFGLRDG